MNHIVPIMPRPKKILTLEEQGKKENRLRVRGFILRVLGHVDSKKIDWIRNSAIAKKFFKQFPNYEFWDWFQLPAFLKESNSDLKPLTGKWGVEFLRKEWNKFSAFKEQNKEFEPPKLTESPANIIIVKTKKSLKEFLK